MKKVIIKQDEQVIRLEDITDDMIVCIYDKLENEKVFLLKDDKGKSFGMSLRDMTIAKKWRKDTHKDYVKEFFNMGNCEVFVLDSPKELAQWLSK